MLGIPSVGGALDVGGGVRGQGEDGGVGREERGGKLREQGMAGEGLLYKFIAWSRQACGCSHFRFVSLIIKHQA